MTQGDPIFNWDFGDVNVSSAQEPQHYSVLPRLARTYEVRVTVCDRSSAPEAEFYDSAGRFDPNPRMFPAGIRKVASMKVMVYSPTLLLFVLVVVVAMWVTTKGIALRDKKRRVEDLSEFRSGYEYS